MCLSWALFVFATSLSWQLGKLQVDLWYRKAVALWLIQAKKTEEFPIENPNEVKQEDKNGKKPKRKKEDER